jgi:hypothetical protein
VQLFLGHFPNSPILNPTLWFPALRGGHPAYYYICVVLLTYQQEIKA